MQKLKTFSFALLVVIFVTQSCTTDFDTYIEGETTPIIYGGINPDDSVYSIRLTKSFVGAGSAYDFALIEDSVYYKDTRVVIETYHKSKLFQSVEMEQTAVQERENGTFLSSPNYLYQVRNDELMIQEEAFQAIGIDYDIELRLSVFLPETDDTIFASSPLLPHPRIINPRSQYRKVYFYGEVPFQMEWAHPMQGNYYEIQVVVEYRDILDDGEVPQTCSWVLTGIQYNESSRPGSLNNLYSYYFRPESFYSQLAASITDSVDVKGRIIGTVDFIILTADPALKEYMRMGELQDDYRGSSFSNIQNGLGLFYTFNTSGAFDLELGIRELDSLAFGRYTRHLRFKNWF